MRHADAKCRRLGQLLRGDRIFTRKNLYFHVKFFHVKFFGYISKAMSTFFTIIYLVDFTLEQSHAEFSTIGQLKVSFRATFNIQTLSLSLYDETDI